MDIDWYTYMSPFQTALWACILAWLILFCIAYLFCAWLDFDLMWTIIHSILGQGYPLDPPAVSLKIIFLQAIYFGAVIWMCFSSVLTSFLVVQRDEIPFNNLETMLFKTDYRIALYDGTYVVDYLSVHPDPIYLLIFHAFCYLPSVFLEWRCC